MRIVWYGERYHGIKSAAPGVRAVLRRHGLNRLPQNANKRPVQTTRYEQQVPGPYR